ncbi:hypothetical protein ACP70R_004609 [Stipagrostis hirtigluma subsp. patula]
MIRQKLARVRKHLAARERELEGCEVVLGVAAEPEPEVVVVNTDMLITLAVQDTERRIVLRTMRKTDELQGLMDYYYTVVSPTGGAARGEGRFVFDGRRVKGERTPEDLGMVSGDKIDFFQDLLAG